MRRIVIITSLLLAAIFVLGIAITSVSKARDTSNHVLCSNNLRVLALLGAPFVREDETVRATKDAVRPAIVWPGTLPNELLKPDERLSWVVLAMPHWNEPRADEAVKLIDRTAAWSATPNQAPSQAVLRTLLCPGSRSPVKAGEPAPTMYVGIAGLGADAAALPLTEPPSANAGAFRYDTATPLDVIRKYDGVSQTLLFGQTTRDLGPWIRGGPSTVRGLLESPPILSSVGGQFGGSFSDGSYFAFCDGAVKLFRYTTDPAILKSLATIHGGVAVHDQ